MLHEWNIFHSRGRKNVDQGVRASRTGKPPVGATGNFVEIPGSRTMAILDLCTTSNVGEPGIWRFTVRGGGVVCGQVRVQGQSLFDHAD